MQACPFELRLRACAEVNFAIELVATQVVAAVRHAIRDHPAVRHLTVLPGGSPRSIEGVAFVVGEAADTWRTVVRLLDEVLGEVPGAGELFVRTAPPAPVSGAESPAMAGSGHFASVDRWPAS